MSLSLRVARMGWVFLAGALAGHAEPIAPGLALQSALNRLVAARNYAWRESRQDTFNTRKSARPYGLGRTEIGGFTIATIIEPHNLRAAFYGTKTAFETKNGWRRTEDFTNAEITEVFGIPETMLEQIPRLADTNRAYTHVFFHEVFAWLMQFATNLREEDGVIVGDFVSPEMEIFVTSGRPPRPRPTGLLGVALPPPPPRPFPAQGQQSASFHVWLNDDGNISKCVLDFSRSGVVSGGANAGKEFSTQKVYTYEITGIGAAPVTISPELAAVFNDVPANR